MRRSLHRGILAICLITMPVFCEEVGYVFSDDGDFELSNVTVSMPNLTDKVAFTTAGTGGSGGNYVSSKTVGELQQIFDQRIESEKVVNDAQDMIVGISPGDHTIDQVCLIYRKIKNSWNVTGDPRGVDYYRFANETLQQGRKANLIGAGDCDDFALLMASMVEAIGGSTRVMLAYSPTGSHAYAEVYLGTIGSENVNKTKKWLKLKYGVREISTHWDKDTGDIWLNLDWGKNIAVAAYPGSPFFDATEHIPIYIKNDTERYPLNPSPMALFVHPVQANAGEPVVFDASESFNVDMISEFEWNFGDGKEIVQGSEYNVSHTYEEGGVYSVTLKVKDDQGSGNSSTSIIHMNNPPYADFTVSPEKPKKGDLVEFDSSPSNDSDGHIAKRYWNLGSWVIPDEVIVEKNYPKSGHYWVNLTVVDDKDASRTKSLYLRVNEPPVANFVPGVAAFIPARQDINIEESITVDFDPSRQDVNVGESIIFDASSSKDPDGKIIDYIWDFGDGTLAENKSLIGHAFTSGGDKTINLVVEDNDTVMSTSFSCQIKVNHPPVAVFTYQIKDGNRIEFNASSSRDEDGKITSYKWDFDDYSGILEATKNKMVHNYDEKGEYNVTLTVADDKGSIDRFSQIVDLQPSEEIIQNPTVDYRRIYVENGSLQNEIDNSNGPTEIILINKSYDIKNAIKIENKTNINIHSNFGLSILKGDDNGFAFIVKNSSNISISDIVLENFTNGFEINNTKNCSIKDNSIKFKCYGYGILIISSGHIEILDNLITNSCTNKAILNASSVGVAIRNSNNIYINNNKVSYDDIGNNLMVAYYIADYKPVDNITIVPRIDSEDELNIMHGSCSGFWTHNDDIHNEIDILGRQCDIPDSNEDVKVWYIKRER